MLMKMPQGAFQHLKIGFNSRTLKRVSHSISSCIRQRMSNCLHRRDEDLCRKSIYRSKSSCKTLCENDVLKEERNNYQYNSAYRERMIQLHSLNFSHYLENLQRLLKYHTSENGASNLGRCDNTSHEDNTGKDNTNRDDSNISGVALASAAVISYVNDEEKLKDDFTVTMEELESTVEDLKHVLLLHGGQKNAQQNEVEVPLVTDHYLDDWTMEWEGPAVTIWSRPMENKDFSQYKIHGRYDDISAIAFFYVQANLSQRKVWDHTTDEIRLLGENDATELVYWRVNFPRLMAKRDYVFVRRTLIDAKRNVLVLRSRAVEHSDKPADRSYVRVTDYISNMAVQPYGSFTENGFDYVMTYIDDTKTRMPASALARLVRSALPRFLEKVHQESKLVMTLYNEWKATGADICSCNDVRVRELHDLIEQIEAGKRAEIAEQQAKEAKLQARAAELQHEKTAGLQQASATKNRKKHTKRLPKHRQSKKESTTAQTKEGQEAESKPELSQVDKKGIIRPLPIQKIRPPAYLPDLRKYGQTVWNEGRFHPIPLRKVHTDSVRCSSPGTNAPVHATNVKCKTDTSSNYPDYKGGSSYPSYLHTALPSSVCPLPANDEHASADPVKTNK